MLCLTGQLPAAGKQPAQSRKGLLQLTILRAGQGAFAQARTGYRWGMSRLESKQLAPTAMLYALLLYVFASSHEATFKKSSYMSRHKAWVTSNGVGHFTSLHVTSRHFMSLHVASCHFKK
jgi:hypothetical protein